MKKSHSPALLPIGGNDHLQKSSTEAILDLNHLGELQWIFVYSYEIQNSRVFFYYVNLINRLNTKLK